MKDAIQAKRAACKAWLKNKADSSLHLRYVEARKSSTHGGKVQNAILER